MYSSKWKMQTSIRQFDMYTNNFLWAQGKIALGSASTALAATLYKYFETTHSLFKFPVVEELDIIRPQFTNRM